MGSEKVGYTDEEMLALIDAEQSEKGLTDKEMMMALADEEANKFSGIESALGGAQDIALMGYGPNIAAAIKTKSISSPEYIAQRDLYNQKIQQMKQEDPGYFLGGQIAGGLGTALIPGVGAAKGASLGSRLARSSFAGGVAGLASDTPDVEGKVADLSGQDQVKERLSQGAFGAVAGPLAELGVTAIKKMTPSSVERAFTALGPDKSARKEARLAGERNALGTKENITSFAKSEKVFDDFPDITEIKNRSISLKQKYGSALNQIYQKAKTLSDEIAHGGMKSENIKFQLSQKDLTRLKNSFVQKIKKEDWSDVDKNSAINEISDYFDSIQLDDAPDILQLHEIKQSIGDKAYRVGKSMQPTGSQDFWRKAGRIIDDEIQSRIASVSNAMKGTDDEVLADALKEANKKYSLSSRLYEISANAVDSERPPYDISGMIRQAFMSPQTQIGLSKIGAVAESVPSYLKPTGPGFAVPLSQIGRVESRMETAKEMVDRALQMGIPPFVIDSEIKKSPLSPTEKAKLRNKNAKAVK